MYVYRSGMINHLKNGGINDWVRNSAKYEV